MKSDHDIGFARPCRCVRDLGFYDGEVHLGSAYLGNGLPARGSALSVAFDQRHMASPVPGRENAFRGEQSNIGLAGGSIHQVDGPARLAGCYRAIDFGQDADELGGFFLILLAQASAWGLDVEAMKRFLHGGERDHDSLGQARAARASIKTGLA